MPAIQAVFAQAVPALTIIGLIVLLALGKIEQTAGLALIAALAGVHGGAAVASSAVKTAAARPTAPTTQNTPTP